MRKRVLAASENRREGRLVDAASLDLAPASDQGSPEGMAEDRFGEASSMATGISTGATHPHPRVHWN